MKKYFPIVILVIFTLVVEYLMFGKVFLHPNSCLIMDNTDGRQIYFNIAYHVKYGTGFNLTNQNYPFFESIFMTDAQASISIVLSWINHHLLSIDDYTIGIVNGIIIYSIVICTLFLYLILRHFKVEKHLSVLFALLICFLSPQLLRIVCGHYGLSYLFYFPVLIYLSLKLNESTFKTYFYSILIVVLILFFGFNNGHMSLAGGLYVFVFGFFQIFMFKKEYKHIRFIPMLIAIVSFLLLFIVIKSIDHVSDREQLPFGFLHYHAQFESIFLPATGPLLDFYNWISPIKVASIQEEGASYVGLVGFIVLIFSVYRILLFVLKRRYGRLIFFTLNKELNVLLFTGILILFYSMAFPFRWGMENILDYMPFIRQFRAPGRFAWIFYYTFSIYIAYFINLVYRRLRLKKKIGLYYFILVCCIAFYTLDITNLKKWNFRYIDTNSYFTNTFSKDRIDDQLLKAYQIDTAHFSSLYGIPVCNSWNSKFERKLDQYEITTKLIDFSYATSLPWINSKLSRVSTFQTLQSGQFVSHPAITREIFSKMDTSKKVLLIVFKSYVPTFGELYVINHSKKLFEDELYSYHEFSFNNNFYEYRDSLIKNFTNFLNINNKTKIKLLKDSSFYLNNPTKEFNSDTIISNMKDEVIIFNNTIKNNTLDSLFEFSIWSVVNNKNENSPSIKIIRSNADNQIIEEKRIWISDVNDYQNGMVRYFYVFKMNSSKENLKVILEKGNGFRFEKMLIKPLNFNYFETIDNKLFFNNYSL